MNSKITLKTDKPDAQFNAYLKTLSQGDFLNLGMHRFAYIRPVQDNTGLYFAIYAADGSRLSVMETYHEAMVATRLNDLEPVTLQ